jgi:hypothetical protein
VSESTSTDVGVDKNGKAVQVSSKQQLVKELRTYLVNFCSSTYLLNNKGRTGDTYTSFTVCGCCGSKILSPKGNYVRFIEQKSIDQHTNYAERGACGFLVFPSVKKEELPLERVFEKKFPYGTQTLESGEDLIHIVWRDF